MSISDNKGTFLDSLPESEQGILLELLNGLRRAKSLDDVNVAAGIAYQRLLGRSETMPQPTDGPDYHAELAFWKERHGT